MLVLKENEMFLLLQTLESNYPKLAWNREKFRLQIQNPIVIFPDSGKQNPCFGVSQYGKLLGSKKEANQLHYF